jgi:hypothetical protein
MTIPKKIYKFLFSLNLKYNRYIWDALLGSHYPDFLIIGAAKCGTTFLKENLNKNPNIFIPRNEVDFFSSNYKMGIDWYTSHFFYNNKIQGDKSPSYIYDQTSHKRMFDHLPHAKLILLLRNPVARAFSNWNMRVNKKSIGNIEGINTYNFKELVDYYFQYEGLEVIKKNPLDILEMGKYIEQIENLLRYYPRENLRIYIYEEVFSNAEASLEFLRDVYTFLNIKFDEKFTYNKRIRSGKYENRLDQETAEKLIHFYEPYNARLAQFLNKTLDSWI